MITRLGVIATLIVTINILLVIGGYETIKIHEEMEEAAYQIAQKNSTKMNIFDRFDQMKEMFRIFIAVSMNVLLAPIAFLSDVGAPLEIRLIVGMPLLTMTLYALFMPLYYLFGIIARRFFS